MGLLHGTAAEPADLRFLDGYLRLRASQDHPCGGCSEPAWVLLHPGYQFSGRSTVIGLIEDRKQRRRDAGDKPGQEGA